MNHFTRAAAARGALFAATALLAAGQTPARAAPHPHAHGNWLHVTVIHGDARGGGTRAALLMCDPPRGHAHAADACAELDAASGDIDALPHEETFCPMIYAPVTARAEGRWNGERVAYAHTFANTCELTARTRHVFALDD
jgi:Subtilisin inhibitor-like